MKLQHFALLAVLVFILAAFVPGVWAQPMTFQSPPPDLPPPIEPPVPDLTGLIVGSASFAPLIWGIVTLIKTIFDRAGRPLSRDTLLGIVFVLGSAAYGVVKYAEVNPSVVPLVENLVQIGLLLLGILLPSGLAVGVHRVVREVRNPGYDRNR